MKKPSCGKEVDRVIAIRVLAESDFQERFRLQNRSTSRKWLEILLEFRLVAYQVDRHRSSVEALPTRIEVLLD